MSAPDFKSGYTGVNGLSMYYEVHGAGEPLVLIHGGGSTLQTTFGNIIPLLAAERQVIAMDLQAHGRTGDREAPLKFEQDADDVVALLRNLNVSTADFLGYSNGGHTVFEIALRHPEMINKLTIASAFYRRDALPQQFWDGFHSATLDHMPPALIKGFLAVNNNETALLNMFNKDVQKMKSFKGWTEAQLRSISAPTLILNGDNDIAGVEHALEMSRLIPNAQLAILPGKHGTYIGAIEFLENGEWKQQYVAGLINHFLAS